MGKSASQIDQKDSSAMNEIKKLSDRERAKLLRRLESSFDYVAGEAATWAEGQVHFLIGSAIDASESPIEMALLCAVYVRLWWASMSSGGESELKVRSDSKIEPPEFGDREGQIDVLTWQFPVGQYRADLAVQRTVRQQVQEGKVQVSTPIVLIECDGHDFHERTKEQAEHDKSRDRALQISGHPVLRFTGSEIHRDADACAAQVEQFLDESISRLLDEEYDRILGGGK